MAGVNFFIILHYSLIKNEANRTFRSAFFFSDVFILLDFSGVPQNRLRCIFPRMHCFLVERVYSMRRRAQPFGVFEARLSDKTSFLPVFRPYHTQSHDHGAKTEQHKRTRAKRSLWSRCEVPSRKAKVCHFD